MNEKQLQDLFDRTEGRLPSLCCSGKCRAWKKPTPAQKKQLAYLKELLKERQEQTIKDMMPLNNAPAPIAPKQSSLPFATRFFFIVLCSIAGGLTFALGDSKIIFVSFGFLLGGVGGYLILQRHERIIQ